MKTYFCYILQWLQTDMNISIQTRLFASSKYFGYVSVRKRICTSMQIQILLRPFIQILDSERVQIAFLKSYKHKKQ